MTWHAGLLSAAIRAVAALAVAFSLAVAGHAEESAPFGRAPFRSGRVSFSVEIKGETCPYEILGVYVMPEEKVRIRVPDERGEVFVASAEAGSLKKISDRAWDWTAPRETGVWPVRVSRSSSQESVLFNVFVMVPATEVKDGVLNGYRIGDYPAKPWKGLPIYSPPRGFVEVTAENEATRISPHFTIGQFLCKEDGGYPKYLVLRERLILKLELILERANAVGLRCDGFVIMSGYRTPDYNRAIGNVTYSRHMWGGAADIYIDEDPVDGVMDDLNGDGRFDVLDAGVLFEVVDNLYGRPFYKSFLGGLARYRRTQSHGPFVHVDVRGFRVRWGD